MTTLALEDPRGVPMTASEPSLALFETALRQLQSYRGDPIATIDAAFAAEPDFVMGHILRAEVCITMWERGFLPEVRRGLEQLERLAPLATDRERMHIAAIRDWAAGDWEGMRARLDRLLDDYPTDVLALQVGHLADFYHGDRDNLRGRVARVLPAWSRDMPGYGFLLGMLAFGQEECGDYGRAEETGRHAIALEPDDCWAQHAVTHVMEMQSRQAEGIAWMDSRRAHWAQDDNGFAFHNWWHTALYHLDQGRLDRVLDIYDGSIRPAPTKVQLQMLDAAALLWRLHLQRADVGSRWTELADNYEQSAEEGFYAFNDMHAMMAFAATGRHCRGGAAPGGDGVVCRRPRIERGDDAARGPVDRPGHRRFRARALRRRGRAAAARPVSGARVRRQSRAARRGAPHAARGGVPLRTAHAGTRPRDRAHRPEAALSIQLEPPPEGGSRRRRLNIASSRVEKS